VPDCVQERYGQRNCDYTETKSLTHKTKSTKNIIFDMRTESASCGECITCENIPKNRYAKLFAYSGLSPCENKSTISRLQMRQNKAKVSKNNTIKRDE